MVRFDKLLKFVVDLLVWCACASGALMMVHVTVDVFFRSFLNAPIPGTIEVVSAYYMVIIAFFPLAYISQTDGHIIVELFTSWLPKKKLSVLNLVVGIVVAGYLTVFVWASVSIAVAKTDEGEVRETAAGYLQVWPSRWLLAVGLMIMAVIAVRQISQQYKSISNGDKNSSETQL